MDLDKRSHDFLMYMQLKNYWNSDTLQLSVKDLRWMVEYLEDRLEYYTKDKKKRLPPAHRTMSGEKLG